MREVLAEGHGAFAGLASVDLESSGCALAGPAPPGPAADVQSPETCLPETGFKRVARFAILCC